MAIKRLYDTLVGATVNVNQLCENLSANIQKTGGTTSYADGVVTFTANANNQQAYVTIVTLENHVYLATAMFQTATATADVHLRAFGANASSTATTATQVNVMMMKPIRQSNISIGVQDGRSSGFDAIKIKGLNCFDLTAMFGSTIADYIYSLESATAGAGIAKLREWGFFTEGYIPYNPGALESVEARSHVMTGKNIWGGLKMAQDITEIVSSAVLDTDNKTVTYTAPSITNKVIFDRFPSDNTQYTIILDGFNTNTSAQTSNLLVRYTDGTSESSLNFVNGKTTFVTNSQKTVKCIEGYWGSQTTTLNYEECGIFIGNITVSDFEPYHEYSYDLGTDTLRGLFKLDSNNNLYADGDTKASDGTVARKYGVVDLGTLDWINAGANKMFYTNALNADIDSARAIRRAVSQDEVFSWGIDSKALAKQSYNSIGTSTPNSICISTAGNILATLDTDTGYKNATEFKTAMSGVMLVYELATPTTEQSTPFTNPQICDPDGTEEYVTSNGVPVGHETRYQL